MILTLLDGLTRTVVSAALRQDTASDLCVRANQRIGPTRTLCRPLWLGLGLRVGLGSDGSVQVIRRSDASDEVFRGKLSGVVS